MPALNPTKQRTLSKHHSPQAHTAPAQTAEPSLPISTCIAYGCGDTACNVVYGMVNTLLTLFYTDYMGIPIVTIGMVLLISRVLDGMFSFIMGIITGKTHTRWGQTRPWILWAAVPYCISAVAIFTIPQTTASLQFWYIFITYNLCTTLCYNMINVPYGTLAPLMTRSTKNRDLLSVFRAAVAPIGRILSVTLTMPVVKLFGDTQQAWIQAMAMWSVIALVLLLICFFRCKETVEVKTVHTERLTVTKSFRALVGNQYFWAVLILWAVTCVHITLVGTSLPYYCKYLLGNDTWMYSTLYLLETIILIGGAFCCPLLLRHFQRRTLALAGCIIVIVAHAALMLRPLSFPMVMVTLVIRACGQVPLTSLIFSMIGDTIEFGHWKSNIRQEALIIGGATLGYKVSTGICSAIITKLMDASGYISSASEAVAQPASALHMIQGIYLIGPLLLWSVAVIVLLLYKLDKHYPRIIAELHAREVDTKTC